MARLSLARKWIVALVALAIVVGGIAAYAWHASGLVGASGWRDACASVKFPADSANVNWIPVTNDSPQAMEQLLSAEPSYTRTLDGPLTPGLPVLVHPIKMHTGEDVNDCPHWLLPERDASGHLVAVADYVYDYSHARVRWSSSGMILPSEPRYTAPFPYLSAAQASALVTSARQVAVKANPAPELVFLPIDIGLPEQPGPGANWRGGGAMPTDPIWLVAGADGQDYFVGKDLYVYTLRDIPLS